MYIWIKKKNKQKFLDARSVFDITNWYKCGAPFNKYYLILNVWIFCTKKKPPSEMKTRTTHLSFIFA